MISRITNESEGMIVLQPIGIVRNSRQVIEDDNWGGIGSEIEVSEPIGQEGLAGIEEFSPAEVIFYFHQKLLERRNGDETVTIADCAAYRGGVD